YIMRPRQTLEGAVVDALRSPNRAARRQASQGQLSLGSRDRHSLRRMQGDGEGHELQRDRRSRGQRRLLRRDRRRQRLLAWRGRGAGPERRGERLAAEVRGGWGGWWRLVEGDSRCNDPPRAKMVPASPGLGVLWSACPGTNGFTLGVNATSLPWPFMRSRRSSPVTSATG